MGGSWSLFYFGEMAGRLGNFDAFDLLSSTHCTKSRVTNSVLDWPVNRPMHVSSPVCLNERIGDVALMESQSCLSMRV